jgi:KDO2-lipid IV(A) lauroyltransferase
MVQKNLRNSFPDLSGEERRKIEKEFYRNMCDYALESIKAISISTEELKSRVSFHNNQMMKDKLSQGQSVIFLTSHQFNWEWLLLGACLEYPGELDFIYQSVSNKVVNDFSLLTRSRFGGFPIERQEVARAAILRKNVVRGIAILADQYPGLGRDKKYEATFLNQPTVFFYGANQLAQLTQYPAYYHHVRRVGRGRYEAWAVEIAQPPYTKEDTRVIDAYIKETERNIIEQPANWLWTHNRWKTRHLRQASAQYPPASTAS